MTQLRILAPSYLLPEPDPESLIKDGAALIEDDRIVAIGTVEALAARSPTALVDRLDGKLLMPGFVNAHQHGRAIGTLQLGYRDDQLESWIAARWRRGPLNAGAQAALAAAEMLRHGVTTAIQANSATGSGDYEAELRATLQAYDAIGLRALVCVGAQDRALTVYPEEATARFVEGCSPELQAVLRGRRSVYAAGPDETLAMMQRLLSDYAGHPRLTLGYGPAGPQWTSDAMFRAIADDSERRGLPVHLHCMESPMQARFCREIYPEGVLRGLGKLGLGSSRVSLAHGVWLTPDDIEVAAGYGMTVVRNPGSNLRLRNGLAPLDQFLEQGLSVAVGTDNTSMDDDEDLLAELRLATDLALGQTGPSYGRAVRPDLADQLAMLTVNGAAAAGLGAQVGRIRAGWQADLTAIDLTHVTGPYLDPLLSPVDALLRRASARDVAMTMVAGRILWRDGELIGQDMAALIEAVRQDGHSSRLTADPQLAALAPELLRRLDSHYGAA
jgi:5-methylthioadenosine/S-adenosylhomocysteine deaminase